jgi:hypothetical protein
LMDKEKKMKKKKTKQDFLHINDNHPVEWPASRGKRTGAGSVEKEQTSSARNKCPALCAHFMR